jgi:hypothetical protein
MKTGAEHCEPLRDGRRAGILGEDLVEGVACHPATLPMFEEHVMSLPTPCCVRTT